MNLDPAKVFVILVIALIVLGPERLPRVARQLGTLWHELTQHRTRLVEQLKEQLPDLPEPGSVRSFLFDSVARQGLDAQGPRLGPDRYLPPTGTPQPVPLDQIRLVSIGEPSELDDPSMN